MSCKECEKFEKEGKIYYIRFGNKELGFTNLGIICCEKHFMLLREKLLELK